MLVALVLHDLLVPLGFVYTPDAVSAVLAALVMGWWLLILIGPGLGLRMGLRLRLVLSILLVLFLIRADILILARRGVFHGEAP